MSSLCIPDPTLFLFSSSTGALKTLINRARESCLRILSSKMISSKAVTSKKMGKNVGFLVCVFIMVVDTVAGVLGIEAEIIQNKVKHSKVLWMFECREPSYKAFQLGLAAAILLAITHFVAHLFGGCTCIWSKEDYRKSTPNKQLAVVFLLLSWIALAVGFSMLIIGTLANSRSRKLCGIAHNRILFIGGILCFFHELFTVAYYVSATAAKKEEKQNRNPPGGPTAQA